MRLTTAAEGLGERRGSRVLCGKTVCYGFRDHQGHDTGKLCRKQRIGELVTDTHSHTGKGGLETMCVYIDFLVANDSRHQPQLLILSSKQRLSSTCTTNFVIRIALHVPQNSQLSQRLLWNWLWVAHFWTAKKCERVERKQFRKGGAIVWAHWLD